jgi:hypothetical protein
MVKLANLRMAKTAFDPEQKKEMRIALEAQILKEIGKMTQILQTIFHGKNGNAVEKNQ